jgi:hypothetical protein
VSSGGWPASPPKPAKVERPGRGTQRSGQVVERRWRKGSGVEEDEQGSGHGSASKEVTGGQARGGARWGGRDLVMADLARTVRSSEQAELVEAVVAEVCNGVWLGLTVTPAPSLPPHP